MPRNPSKLEASAQRFYTLTDRFRGQLRVLEDAASPVEVKVSAMHGDIQALAFLALMEASRSAQEDLKAILESVKEINREKGLS